MRSHRSSRRNPWEAPPSTSAWPIWAPTWERCASWVVGRTAADYRARGRSHFVTSAIAGARRMADHAPTPLSPVRYEGSIEQPEKNEAETDAALVAAMRGISETTPRSPACPFRRRTHGARHASAPSTTALVQPVAWSGCASAARVHHAGPQGGLRDVGAVPRRQQQATGQGAAHTGRSSGVEAESGDPVSFWRTQDRRAHDYALMRTGTDLAAGVFDAWSWCDSAINGFISG